MTVASAANRNGPYTADGIVTVFARTFKVLDADHLKVYQTIGATTTEVTTGIVKNDVDQPTGDVTFLVAPVAGSQITLIREVPLSQDSDYSNEGTVEPEQVEDDLDKIAMILQDLSERVDRSYTQPLVGLTLTPGNVPIYDATGALVDSGVSSSALIAASDNATAQAAAAAVSAAAAAASAAAIDPAELLKKDGTEWTGLTNVGSMRTALELQAGAQAQKATDGDVDTGTDDAKFTTVAKVLRAIDARSPKLLHRVVAASAAEVQLFTGMNATTYADYVLKFFSAIPDTNAAELRLRTTSDAFATAADAGASDYTYAFNRARAGTTASHDGVNNATEIHVVGQIGNTAGHPGAMGEIIVKEPGLSLWTQFIVETSCINDGSELRAVQGTAARKEADVVTGFEFRASTGTISGTFELFGIPRQ